MKLFYYCPLNHNLEYYVMAETREEADDSLDKHLDKEIEEIKKTRPRGMAKNNIVMVEEKRSEIFGSPSAYEVTEHEAGEVLVSEIS